MKLCFLVNVRKANGRNVAGGSSIGNIVVLFCCGLSSCNRIGWTGALKAGEEDGMGLACAGVAAELKRGVTRAVETFEAPFIFEWFFCTDRALNGGTIGH